MDLVPFARYKRGGGQERLLNWELSVGLKDWDQAPAPAHIGRRISGGVFQHQLPSEWAALTSNLTHRGYRVVWGGLFGLMEGSLHARRIRHGLALDATVWTARYMVLPLARLYRSISAYAAKVLAKDFADHLVYGLGAASTDHLLAGR